MKYFILVLCITFSLTTVAQVKKIENLDASKGWVYFNIETGKSVTGDKPADGSWHLGFNKTNVIVNSGKSGNGKNAALVVESTFEQLKKAPSAGYKQDNDESNAIPTGSGNGWYNYNMEDHSIVPIAHRTIVLKTGEGKYYKIKMISYNKNQQLFEPTGFYTFEYAAL